jgi:hypothetical protein
MEKVDLNYPSPHHSPTIFAGEFSVRFPSPVTDRELKGKISAFFSGLLDFLFREGCRLIGHIKGLVLTEEKGLLLVNITSFRTQDAFKGNLPGLTSKASLTLNVIVFGVSEEKIRSFVEQEVQKISRS